MIQFFNNKIKEGLEGCPYYDRAVELAETLSKKFHDRLVFESKSYDRQDWNERRIELQKVIKLDFFDIQLIPGAQNHKTSPFVYEGCAYVRLFIGGSDDFFVHAKNKFNQ